LTRYIVESQIVKVMTPEIQAECRTKQRSDLSATRSKQGSVRSYAVTDSKPTANHSPQVASQLWANARRASASAFAQAESQECIFAVRNFTVGLL
jgi:hypothetical protein